MLIATQKYRLLAISTVLIGIFCFSEPAGNAESENSETLTVLQSLYRDEMQAINNYQAYKDKAASEKYPNIARLFTALGASESIHARNFKACLVGSGAEVRAFPLPPVKAASTRQNLKIAIAVELEEIDGKYPRVLEKIKSENHTEAIRYITYAWESEKQHRELLKKIKSGTGVFFGLLTKRIEGAASPYFVCQNCGSTLSKIPEPKCPICGGPSAKYKEIKMAPGVEVIDEKKP